MADYGRATNNIVSGYQRDRVFKAALYANESRQLVTNFNGVIPKGRTVAKAVWQTQDQVSIYMSGPSITGKSVSVRAKAQYSGTSRIRVDVTLDNGDVYSAWHVIQVRSAPYFNNPGWVTGPNRLEVLA